MAEAIAKFFSVIAQYAIIALGIIFALAVIFLVLVIVFAKKRKKKKQQQITKVEQTDNGRYSLEDDLAPQQTDGQSNASFAKEDVVVSKGQTLVAGKNNDIAIGKYTVLTTVDGVEAFNVRINGFVREIQHNTVIVLGEGDSICPVSHSIILR